MRTFPSNSSHFHQTRAQLRRSSQEDQEQGRGQREPDGQAHPGAEGGEREAPEAGGRKLHRIRARNVG